MASFDIAFDWLMHDEDPNRRYTETIDNNGGGVISGINSKSFPDDFERIKQIPQALRGNEVKEFYRVHFWNQWLGQLNSDEIAKRVVNMWVNGGPAVRYLQQAIVEAGGNSITIDGAWGPHTVAEANACNEYQIVSAFKAERAQYYRDVVERNPAYEPDLKGWLARAER